MKTKIDLQNVGGWTRQGKSLTRVLEDQIYEKIMDWIPTWIHPNWLTLLSPFLGAAIVVGALLARQQPLWRWSLPILIFIHYVADCLDGKLGRKRQVGYILWGFYMDHFLDCIFNNSILFALMITYPQEIFILGFGMILIGASMLAESLHAATIGTYRIYGQFGLGSTEGTMTLIAATAYLAVNNPESLPRGLFYLAYAIVLTQLIRNVYDTQKELAAKDMANKKLKAAKNA